MSGARRALRDRAPRAVRTLDLPEACELPQLAAIVEPGRLTRVLGEALAHATPTSPELLISAVTKLHYRPGKGCRLVISARFGTGRGGAGEEQLYFGRLVTAARKAARANGDAATRDGVAAPRFGPPSLHLADWDLKLWAYPNDPELPGLALLADPERVGARLASAPEVFGFERPPRAIRARRAKYVPGKRCGYVYDVSGWKAHGRAPARRVYGKCYAGSAGRTAHEAAWSVWNSGAARAGRVRLPRPFACDESLGVVWQEGLDGRPILKRRGQALRLPDVAGEIGSRLAALHGAALALPREMDHAFQLEMLRESLAAARALPDSAAEARALGERLLALGERFPELPAVTLHGSFRLSHIMETADGIAFIDLDGANTGDPGVDLGRFLAHLRRLEAQGSIPPPTADAAARAFCRGYQADAPVPVSDERIGWATALHLVSGGLDKALRRMDARRLAALTGAAARSCPA
jgi:aminoglycoside phosphotransferase (APT) family kinase protein